MAKVIIILIASLLLSTSKSGAICNDTIQSKIFDGIVLEISTKYDFRNYFDNYYNLQTYSYKEAPRESYILDSWCGVRFVRYFIPSEEYSESFDTLFVSFLNKKYHPASRKKSLARAHFYPIESFAIIQADGVKALDTIYKDISFNDIRNVFLEKMSKTMFYINGIADDNMVYRLCKIKFSARLVPQEVCKELSQKDIISFTYGGEHPDSLYVIDDILEVDTAYRISILKPFFPNSINVRTFRVSGKNNISYLYGNQIYNIVHSYCLTMFDLEWRSTHGESLVIYKDVKENPGEPIEAPKGQKFLLSVSKYEKNLLHVFIFNEKKELQAIGWISQSNNLQYCVNSGETIVYNRINGKEQDIIGSDGNNKTVQFLKVKNGWFKIKYYSKNNGVRTGWICNKDNKE